MYLEFWNLFWEIRQSNQIAKQGQRTGDLKVKVLSTDDKLERLMLINAALWEISRDRLGLSDEELIRKVEEIDLRDGRLDGKMSQGPLKCESCDRVINKKHLNCLYCGNVVGGSPFK